MNKKEFKKLMKTYNISVSDLDNIFAFVADLLYVIARDMEMNQPYAVRDINSLHNASVEVNNLMDYYISEIMEEEG